MSCKITLALRIFKIFYVLKYYPHRTLRHSVLFHPLSPSQSFPSPSLFTASTENAGTQILQYAHTSSKGLLYLTLEPFWINMLCPAVRKMISLSTSICFLPLYTSVHSS